MNKIKSKIAGVLICTTLAAASMAYAQNTGDQPMQQPMPVPMSGNNHMNGYHNTMDAPAPMYHNQSRHSSSRHGNNAVRDNTNMPHCWRQDAQNDYNQNDSGYNNRHGRHRGHRYE